MNGDQASRQINDVFPSVVLPLTEAADYIEAYLIELHGKLSSHFNFFEIIIVNNGASDQTLNKVSAQLHQLNNLSLYNLAHRYSIGVATIAGLDHAIGDYVVILDPRRDPAHLAIDMVAMALDEHDIVYAIPHDRLHGRSLYNRAEAAFLHFLGKMNRTHLPPVLSSARLFSRQALNFILKAADRHRILSLAPALSGYKTASIEYEPIENGPPEPGAFKWFYSIYRAAELTLTLSTKPLRIAALLCLSISFLSVLYSFYVVGYWLTHESVASGWASLSLQISGLFFLVSLVLALISEYMQQILENIGRRPLYFYTTHMVSDEMSFSHDSNVLEEKNEATETPAQVGEEQ